jgi:hypothetical protein
MLNWVVRILLAAAGVIAAWFVAPEASNFAIVQMVVSLLLITFFVGLAAFWPSLVRLFRPERRPEGR